jgi:flagellar motor switch protein FliG
MSKEADMDMNDGPWNSFDREAYFNEIMNKPFLSEKTCKLETVIPDLDEISIQKIIRDLDAAILMNALKGASGRVQASFYKTMGKSALWLMLEDMEYTGEVPENEIASAQDALISVYNDLLSKGEINGQ